MGIVDTWHATINFKIMVHALNKFLQNLTCQNPMPAWLLVKINMGNVYPSNSVRRVAFSSALRLLEILLRLM